LSKRIRSEICLSLACEASYFASRFGGQGFGHPEGAAALRDGKSTGTAVCAHKEQQGL
jgi:hypothetical protein